MIADNTCVNRVFKKAVFANSLCGCADSMCNNKHQIIIEADSDIETIDITIGTRFYPDGCYERRTFLGNVFWRLKTAFNILVHGYVDIQHDFIFADEDHARAYCNVITEAIDHIKKNADA